MGRVAYLDDKLKPGDSVHKVASVKQNRRIRRILNDLQGIGCRVVKDTSKEGHGWRIIVDGQGGDIPFPDGEGPSPCEPTDPKFYKTLGTDTKGDEAAETDTWTYGDVDGNGEQLGLRYWVQVRQSYYSAGDHKWYAYARIHTFSTNGMLFYVGPATRIEVEAPVGHSTL